MSCCQRTYGPGPCCSPEQTRVVHLIRSVESTTARGAEVQAAGAGSKRQVQSDVQGRGAPRVL